MGNKTPPPSGRRTTTASSMNQLPPHTHAPPSPSAEGPLLRCPACTRTVRAPPGAQRFRCPCGRILAQPSLTSASSAPTMTSTHSAPAFSPPLQSQTRSVPPSQPTPYQPPLQSANRSIPPAAPQSQFNVPQTAPMRVRCPSCQQILLAPNAPQFRCPCGQMLRRPGPLATPQAPVQPTRTRVRCPRCATILEAPPNARVFQCRCGIHLAPPASANVSSRALPTTTSEREDVDLTNGLSLVAHTLKTENVGNWRRRVVGDRLGWRKLFTEADEAMVMDAEEAVMETINEEFLSTLSAIEIKQKLTRLDLDTRSCVEKRDLIHKAIDACTELARVFPEAELRRRLEERGLDPAICQDSGDLAARLFAYEWSEGRTTQCVLRDGYVRIMTPQHTLTWGSASDFFVPMGSAARAQEILRVASDTFLNKAAWFRNEMNRIRIPWESGHVKVVVRRSNILEDAFNRVYNLPTADMHKFFRYEFQGEPGLDAGGIAREWFALTSDASFNVDLGLFEYGGTDNVCYQISPNSGLANEHHLAYFKFFGRLLGRALFEGQQIGAHLTRVFYKHLLAWPIVKADVEFVDQEVANSMKQIHEMDDVSMLCLDFTTTMSVFGDNQVVELKPGGKDIDVTNDNKEEFLELRMKQLCMGRVAPQLYNLLSGFYEVVPMELLSVFDFNEIELLLCGLPKISVEDWKANTMYRGEYEALGINHPVIRMFWEVISQSNDEQRAKFLQFATGTARVPVQGFAALQGNDGNVKPFTIDSLKISDSVYPKAHTCFNRIDLPMYTTKEEMAFRMAQALQLEGVGFQIE